MFGFNKSQQNNGALNLSMSGAPTNNQYGNNLGVGLPAAQFIPQQQQQTNPFMGGMMGGMGMNQQQQQQMMMNNGQIAPPSEMEIMAALLQSQNPIHRFIAEGGLATVIDLVATATSLSLINILKNATFVMNEDEGAMKLDATALPTELQTLSAENVSMLLNNIVAQSTQTVQQAEMQRQQIMAMAQQSMMGGALSAALQDEGMMNKVGGGIGSVARGLIGLPTNK
tara:strand:+ start:4467 stop:5144 length:678 start_codon:yes stop_codon:yes gene_type:complete